MRASGSRGLGFTVVRDGSLLEKASSPPLAK